MGAEAVVGRRMVGGPEAPLGPGAVALDAVGVQAGRCQASNRLSGDHRCTRRSSVRVTGTRRVTVDLCAQHGRMAVDRPRLVREWLRCVLEGDTGPMSASAGGPLPLAGQPDALMRVAADLRSLAVIRAAVSRALARNGWADDLHPVLLAVNEASANAIEHGSGPRSQVEVAVTVDPGRVRVRVADGGRLGAALPLGTPAPPRPDRLRGRGLPMMHALCARVLMHNDGDGTVVLLEFAPPVR